MFELLWVDITDRCNYQCAFCRGNYALKSIPKTPSEDEFNNIKLKLKYLDTLNTKYNISDHLRLSGGEPCLYELNEILNYVKSFNDIEVVTNLSKSYEYYESLDKKFKITASLHEDYCDVDSFINKANLLNCTVIITLSNKSVDYYYNLINKFKCKLIITPVCDKDPSGNDVISNIVDKNLYRFISGNSTNQLNNALRIWTNNRFNLIKSNKQVICDGFIYDDNFINLIK